MIPPTDPGEILALLSQASDYTYQGGVNGTCYECPFASPPLDASGREADWDDISNDPTEAYFRCSLPGRDNSIIEWGEYSPCTEGEWVLGTTTALAERYAVLANALDQIENLSTKQVYESGHLVPVYWVPAPAIREIIRATKGETSD